MTKTDREILENLDMDKLAETIALVRNVRKIEFGGGRPTGERTKDGTEIFTMPYPIYPECVLDALKILGSDVNYLKYADKVRSKEISRMSLTDLRRLFTYYLRGERFCDGLIAEFVEDGLMLKALERTQQIAEANKPR
jgi:hypothetical protein